MNILIILVIALIVIPPDKLPEAARALGNFLNELKSVSDAALREVGEIVDEIPVRRPSAAKETSKSPEVVDIAQLLLSSNEPAPRS